MMRRLGVAAVVAAIAVALAGAPVVAVGAEEPSGVVAGGGSLSNVIVPLPRGQSIGPINSVYLVNRTNAPVTAQWFQAVPTGVTISPSLQQTTLAPGENTTVIYSVATDTTLVPGDYQIQVGLTLIKTDASGGVTFAPGFRTDWTLRVVDAKAFVDVRTVGGQPNDVISLERINDTAMFDMARAAGTQLRTTVAPGAWRARVERNGAPLAAKQFVAGDLQRLVVTLNTASRKGRVALVGRASPWYASGWVWLAGGVVLGGVVTLAAVGGLRRRARTRAPAAPSPPS